MVFSIGAVPQMRMTTTITHISPYSHLLLDWGYNTDTYIIEVSTGLVSREVNSVTWHHRDQQRNM